MSKSRVETAISLKNRTDPNVASQLTVPVLRTRSSLQRKACWTKEKQTAFIDTVCRGWVCSPIFILEREPENDETNDETDEPVLEDHVFDGAHKLEAVFEFIDNKFMLTKIHDSSPLKEFIGKKYSDLPKPLKTMILNYEFRLNYIDPACSNDPDSLMILWARLNNSGTKLNDFELSVPIITDLLKYVLKPSLPLFLKTPVYIKDTSNRGECESLLQLLLIVSDSKITDDHMNYFTSKKDLVKRWQTACLGENMKDIKSNTENNTTKWIQLLKRASDYMKYLGESNCFVNSETGANILQSAFRKTELVFLLGRSVFHFSKPEQFRRICNSLADDVKENYFKKIHRDEAGRNGILQKKVLQGIDSLVRKYLDDIPSRSFTKEQIEKKKLEQNNICALCKKNILANQSYHGDHIIPWSIGGETTETNLQVCHKRCNLVKGKKESIILEQIISVGEVE